MVFFLSDIEGLTAPEIAAALGVKLNTVYGRLRLARKRFEKVVAQQDSTTGDAPAPAIATVLGMTVSSMTDELRQKYTIDADIKGAVVTEVTADSPAADKRLEPGDVITEAGEKAVSGAADISTSIADAEKAGKNSVLLLVSKGGKKTEMRFIALKLKK